MQAEAGAHHQKADRRNRQKGGKGQHMDIADERHGKAWQRAAFERTRHALVARCKIKPERGCRRCRNVKRNAGHDEIGAKPVDRKRHQPAEKRTDHECGQQQRRCHAQDGADEMRIENLRKNGCHACTPACSPSRLRKLLISRNTVG